MAPFQFSSCVKVSFDQIQVTLPAPLRQKLWVLLDHFSDVIYWAGGKPTQITFYPQPGVSIYAVYEVVVVCIYLTTEEEDIWSLSRKHIQEIYGSISSATRELNISFVKELRIPMEWSPALLTAEQINQLHLDETYKEQMFEQWQDEHAAQLSEELSFANSFDIKPSAEEIQWVVNRYLATSAVAAVEEMINRMDGNFRYHLPTHASNKAEALEAYRRKLGEEPMDITIVNRLYAEYEILAAHVIACQKANDAVDDILKEIDSAKEEYMRVAAEVVLGRKNPVELWLSLNGIMQKGINASQQLVKIHGEIDLQKAQEAIEYIRLHTPIRGN